MFQRFVPKQYVTSIYQIDFQELKRAGYRGIITDLDNTLVGWSEKLATPKLLKWLDDVRDQYGMQVTIVSNNKEARVSEFAAPLNIKYIAKARKPRGSAFDQAMQWMGTSSKETIVIGDQIFTDIWGGNRIGLFTILVVPIHSKEWIGTRVLRMMERLVLSKLRKQNRLP